MSGKVTVNIIKVIWLLLYVGALVVARPWEGTLNADFSFFYTLSYLTLPVSILGNWLFDVLSSWAQYTQWYPSFWWVGYLLLQLVLGYIQWFIIVPILWRRVYRWLRSDKEKK